MPQMPTGEFTDAEDVKSWRRWIKMLRELLARVWTPADLGWRVLDATLVGTGASFTLSFPWTAAPPLGVVVVRLWREDTQAAAVVATSWQMGKDGTLQIVGGALSSGVQHSIRALVLPAG
jgi:hypothetical protein